MRLNHRFKNCIILLIGIVYIMLTINGCDVKQTSMGYQHRLFIIVDSTLWKSIKTPVDEQFHSIIHTPHVENSFYTTPIPLEDLNEFRSRMNLMFIGLANRDDPVSKYMRDVLPTEVTNDVESGRYFYVFQDDLFARDQIGIFLYAKDKQDFLTRFNTYKDDIYSKFEKKYFARLKKTMFEHGYEKEIYDFLKKNYGWTIKVQHDYFIAIQDLQDNYVWLRRIQPDRWISIWELNDFTAKVNRDTLIQIRNRMGQKYYEGDQVVEEDTHFEHSMLSGRESKKLVGVWKNDSLMVGGPFRCYAFKSEQKQALYVIDIAVMAPGQNKKPYLDQLEVIADTFDPNPAQPGRD
ncbi:MAG: DUF4837 family protein [Caldithrix sp.]|nr:DUF4837 family protein [Caldithrix sp.]